MLQELSVPFFGIDRTTFTAASNLASTGPAMFTANGWSRVMAFAKRVEMKSKRKRLAEYSTGVKRTQMISGPLLSNYLAVAIYSKRDYTTLEDHTRYFV